MLLREYMEDYQSKNALEILNKIRNDFELFTNFIEDIVIPEIVTYYRIKLWITNHSFIVCNFDNTRAKALL